VHRSKLTAALVDVPADVYNREVGFWSAALGREAEVDVDNPEYSDFGQPVPGFQFMLQRVDAPARVHLDIETDDVEAEVRRLEALGAERVGPVKSWWVMRDPAGLLFCVVRIQTGDAFEGLAQEWPDPG
jgi:predicted enzyme related to lactoylglutathione lyase